MEMSTMVSKNDKRIKKKKRYDPNAITKSTEKGNECFRLKRINMTCTMRLTFWGWEMKEIWIKMLYEDTF